MPSYSHKKIIERVVQIDDAPKDDTSYQKWIKAGQHLEFLESNASSSEVIIYCSNEYTFIHSMFVPNSMLSPPDREDLLQWSCSRYTSAASYVYGGSRNDVWIEQGPSHLGSKALDAGKNIIYARTFEGWSGEDKSYYELNQEFAHLLGVHWRPEHKAYCNFDDSGDLDHVFSITKRSGEGGGISLVSCHWEPLEKYLAVANCSLEPHPIMLDRMHRIQRR